MFDFITLTDGYKLDHRRQYPDGTEYVYANFTPRSTRIPGQDKVVFFGLQYFLQRYLGEVAQETFFNRPRGDVLREYESFVSNYLGSDDIGVEHIADLHDLGYIPLSFMALPEGVRVPLRVPMFTVENTHPDFFWMTNYIETLMSSVLWLPCTSATTAYRYRQILDQYAHVSGDPSFVPWQGHDFSFRGMASPEAAALSGAGHLLSFTGTDTLPALKLLHQYYHSDGLAGGSVPATEHSVMCAGGKATELETFDRLLDLYPKGIVSVVSDTWDLWSVVTDIVPRLKDKILARDGKLVIRPDSGDPVDIICGTRSKEGDTVEERGLVQALWDVFGGTVNEKGFKVLDSHIGAIYGDSITESRAAQICARLNVKGFASTNVVLGIGSYTYQYVTRDTNGFAVKATWTGHKDGEALLFKDPKTDDGGKKSARGRIVITRNDAGELQLVDGLNYDEWSALRRNDLLREVWTDGKFIRRQTLAEVRQALSTNT